MNATDRTAKGDQEMDYRINKEGEIYRVYPYYRVLGWHRSGKPKTSIDEAWASFREVAGDTKDARLIGATSLSAAWLADYWIGQQRHADGSRSEGVRRVYRSQLSKRDLAKLEKELARY